MTIDERFARIEHYTAGMAEERRKEREEDRQLWRDTQRQLGEIGVRLNNLTMQIAEVDDRLGKRIDQLAGELQKYAADSRAADEALGRRIADLVSSMGAFLRAANLSPLPPA